jgi:hypothetical protein
MSRVNGRDFVCFRRSSSIGSVVLYRTPCIPVQVWSELVILRRKQPSCCASRLTSALTVCGRPGRFSLPASSSALEWCSLALIRSSSSSQWYPVLAIVVGGLNSLSIHRARFPPPANLVFGLVWSVDGYGAFGMLGRCCSPLLLTHPYRFLSLAGRYPNPVSALAMQPVLVWLFRLHLSCMLVFDGCGVWVWWDRPCFVIFSLWIHFHVSVIYRHLQKHTYPRALRLALIAAPCIFFVAAVTLHTLHAALDRRRYRGLARLDLVFITALYVYLADGG